jgi:hypothetical protein
MHQAQTRWWLAAGAVMSALAITACSSGRASPTVPSLGTTTTAASAVAATTGRSSSGGELGEYASCMRSHGVLSFPDAASFGSSDGIKAAKGQMAQISESEAPSPTFQGAQRACAKYLGPPTTSAPVSTQEMQKLLAVAHCMGAHGVPNFPDPNPTTGELAAPAGIDRNAPQVLAALLACRSLGQVAGLGPPSTGQ